MDTVTIDLSEDDSDNLDDLPELNLGVKRSHVNEIPQSGSIGTHTCTDLTNGSTKNINCKSKHIDQAADKQSLKILKPGECMKHMVVEMHPTLMERWYCADVLREVGASGARVQTSSTLCDVALVMWRRLLEPTLTNSNGMVALATEEKSDHGLYITHLDDIQTYIHTQTLSKHMKEVADLAGCKLTLVVFAPKNYFKSSGRKTSNSNHKIIQPVDVEMALTDLLVSSDCDTITVTTPNEVALTIVHFTKAIAEAPYKQAKRLVDEQADFYMRGDNKKCVPIAANGSGIGMLWQQMLAVLPHSSLETARTIRGQYQTPRALYKALMKPSGVDDLANLGVSRSAVPGAKTRRIGNEFARKLHVLFTADDGDSLVE
ncbi:crossover junction endonuclease EME1 isoform X1 [Leptidea sinapis]|uniref:crossover junction endonuclease EME1 isoform X1 n=1 Tax=Leptidea sinapis TaxID=189913 RepID=UPI0021216837|nr:crossover junction endonuclease EME1 isoform X1 [Leptidea sinapis]